MVCQARVHITNMAFLACDPALLPKEIRRAYEYKPDTEDGFSFDYMCTCVGKYIALSALLSLSLQPLCCYVWVTLAMPGPRSPCSCLWQDFNLVCVRSSQHCVTTTSCEATCTTFLLHLEDTNTTKPPHLFPLHYLHSDPNPSFYAFTRNNYCYL